MEESSWEGKKLLIIVFFLFFIFFFRKSFLSFDRFTSCILTGFAISAGQTEMLSFLCPCSFEGSSPLLERVFDLSHSLEIRRFLKEEWEMHH